MVTFQVPTHVTAEDRPAFTVSERAVLLAGSRRGVVAPQTAAGPVAHLRRAGGIAFTVGPR